MDEYNSGMDPELKKYFRKIMNSFSAGLLWLVSVATTGLFFGLAIARGGWHWYNTVFYLMFIASFMVLLRYFYRSWSGKSKT